MKLNTVKKGTADLDVDANQVLDGLQEITLIEAGELQLGHEFNGLDLSFLTYAVMNLVEH